MNIDNEVTKSVMRRFSVTKLETILTSTLRIYLIGHHQNLGQLSSQIKSRKRRIQLGRLLKKY